MLKFLFFLLFMSTNSYSQIGGTKSETDTTRLADKFHAYKIQDGQRLDASKTRVDTIVARLLFSLPEGEPQGMCGESQLGFLMYDENDNKIYFCDATSWKPIAYDSDRDGLTTSIDTDDNSAFTAGTAGSSQVLSGKSFYTGSNMTYTTGSITNQGAPTITGDNVYLNGYYSGGNISIISPGTGSPDAGTGQVLSNYEFWYASGPNGIGTMGNNGSANFTLNGTYGGGYYSSVTLNVSTHPGRWHAGNDWGNNGPGNAAISGVNCGFQYWNSYSFNNGPPHSNGWYTTYCWGKAPLGSTSTGDINGHNYTAAWNSICSAKSNTSCTVVEWDIRSEFDDTQPPGSDCSVWGGIPTNWSNFPEGAWDGAAYLAPTYENINTFGFYAGNPTGIHRDCPPFTGNNLVFRYKCACSQN